MPVSCKQCAKFIKATRKCSVTGQTRAPWDCCSNPHQK